MVLFEKSVIHHVDTPLTVDSLQTAAATPPPRTHGSNASRIVRTMTRLTWLRAMMSAIPPLLRVE